MARLFIMITAVVLMNTTVYLFRCICDIHKGYIQANGGRRKNNNTANTSPVTY